MTSPWLQKNHAHVVEWSSLNLILWWLKDVTPYRSLGHWIFEERLGKDDRRLAQGIKKGSRHWVFCFWAMDPHQRRRLRQLPRTIRGSVGRQLRQIESAASDSAPPGAGQSRALEARSATSLGGQDGGHLAPDAFRPTRLGVEDEHVPLPRQSDVGAYQEPGNPLPLTLEGLETLEGQQQQQQPGDVGRPAAAVEQHYPRYAATHRLWRPPSDGGEMCEIVSNCSETIYPSDGSNAGYDGIWIRLHSVGILQDVGRTMPDV